MLQYSASPATRRPRPPRTRSGLGDSVQRAIGDCSTVDDSGTSGVITSMDPTKGGQYKAVPATSLLHVAIAPDTPPYTPILDQAESSGTFGQDGTHDTDLETLASSKTARELASLLAEAQRVIQAREADLDLAASLGKTLLNDNAALRARQDALSMLVSPERGRTTDRTEQGGSGLPDFTLQQPRPRSVTATSLSAYVEDRPPRSLRPSVTRDHASQPILSLPSWANVVARPSPEGARTPSCSPPRSRHQSCSNLVDAGSDDDIDARWPKSATRPSTTNSKRPLSSSTYLQMQHAALQEQNTQLELRLEELEGELNRANATGRKRLRKLDRELIAIKGELDQALDRNAQLESRSSGRKRADSHCANDALSGGEAVGRSADQANAMRLDKLLPCQEADEPLPTGKLPRSCSEASSIASLHNLSESISASFSSIAYTEASRDTENTLVAQLVTKVEELEMANVDIEKSREAMDEKLDKATADFAEMRRKYEFLESRILESEARSHGGPPGHTPRRTAMDWSADLLRSSSATARPDISRRPRPLSEQLLRCRWSPYSPSVLSSINGNSEDEPVGLTPDAAPSPTNQALLHQTTVHSGLGIDVGDTERLDAFLLDVKQKNAEHLAYLQASQHLLLRARQESSPASLPSVHKRESMGSIRLREHFLRSRQSTSSEATLMDGRITLASELEQSQRHFEEPFEQLSPALIDADGESEGEEDGEDDAVDAPALSSDERKWRLKQLAQEIMQCSASTEIDSDWLEQKLAAFDVAHSTDQSAAAPTQSRSLIRRARMPKYVDALSEWAVSISSTIDARQLVMRARRSTSEQIAFCFLWVKFLTVLTIAVLASLWRGPRHGLGLTRSASQQLVEARQS